jgi:hypothetical protein
MNINQAFPSTYLKSSDLGTAQPTVVIDRVEIESIGRDKEQKPVLYFVGKEKGLVLNKTNARKITELAGSSDTEHWHGVKVKLYATETQFGSETVECVRVKAALAAPTPPRPATPTPISSEPVDEGEIPF